jgi:hypothetical protein
MVLKMIGNTKVATERSEIMLERSDDYLKGDITNRVKRGGVCLKLPLFESFFDLAAMESIK